MQPDTDLQEIYALIDREIDQYGNPIPEVSREIKARCERRGW